MNYKLMKYGMILKIPENLWIPPEPANSDYQKYLKWLSEGNEPLPLDEDPQT